MTQFNFFKITLLSLFVLQVTTMQAQQHIDKLEPVKSDMMVRIAEIEILPEYLSAYKAILLQEASQSIKIEPGVIAIVPMYEKENPAKFKLLEIYANKAAYQSHLQTAHFKRYKVSTVKMVKSLKLVEMDALDLETMGSIFKKLN